LLQGKLDHLQELANTAADRPTIAPPVFVDEHLTLDEEGQRLVFTPRLFAQLALPYKDPGDVAQWIRQNGGLKLTMSPGRVVDPRTGTTTPGYPYGVVPRLLVIWMATEAVKTQSRELLLGPSLTSFLGQLGLKRGGGPTGPSTRVRNQITRLFGSSMLVEETQIASLTQLGKWAMDTFKVARRAELWWSADQPFDSLCESTVVLSEEFFEAIIGGAVPLDENALAELRSLTRSPMALDIYAWLAHRLRYVKKPSTVPWKALADQFGGDYGRTRAFKAQFLKDLAHVLVIYPMAKVEPVKGGLLLRRSPAPVLPGHPILVP